MKCQQCDRETDLPFRCSYCQGYFCVNHKLPENHHCPNLPKRPKFWYQKKRLTDKQALEVESELGVCPQCGAKKSEMLGFDAKTMTFKCENCGHRWTQLKASPHRVVEPETELESKVEPKREEKIRKPRRARAKPRVLALSIILIVAIPVVAYASYSFGCDSGYVQGVIDGAGTGYNIRDPTYQEALQFTESDQTDKNPYDEENYYCFHFTADFKSNAYTTGYRCGLVYIEFVEGAHAIACFSTTDHGLIFIEPQWDDIVTLPIGQSYSDVNGYESPLYDDMIIRYVIIW